MKKSALLILGIFSLAFNAHAICPCGIEDDGSVIKNTGWTVVQSNVGHKFQKDLFYNAHVEALFTDTQDIPDAYSEFINTRNVGQCPVWVTYGTMDEDAEDVDFSRVMKINAGSSISTREIQRIKGEKAPSESRIFVMYCKAASAPRAIVSPASPESFTGTWKSPDGMTIEIGKPKGKLMMVKFKSGLELPGVVEGNHLYFLSQSNLVVTDEKTRKVSTTKGFLPSVATISAGGNSLSIKYGNQTYRMDNQAALLSAGNGKPIQNETRFYLSK